MEHGLPGDESADVDDEQTAGEPTLGVPRLHTVGMSQTVQVPVGGLETRVYPPPGRCGSAQKASTSSKSSSKLTR